MIRESEYFIFNNRKSTDFNIRNVSISSGLYEEPLFASRSIKEVKIRKRHKPYFIGIEKEPLSFQLSFYFDKGWDESSLQEVTKWLSVDYYKPLIFNANLERVYYAIPTDSPSLIHNGLKEGYITINMRCDSPYSYSPEKATPWYDCSGITNLEFDNYGDTEIKPEILIKKKGYGDVSIKNLSSQNPEFNISNLLDKEEIYVDGENEIIETNLLNTWRYDDFNDNYLSIPYGRNILQVEGHCKIKFIYHFNFN